MSDKSSGVYVIDKDYNIVSCNSTILELYPQLARGGKCYKCLMNLDEPCPPCPVAGHIHGPQTYLDPIRGIYETVDAVEMQLEDGSTGHALVMSTVGDKAMISAKLPKTQDELTKLLEHDYYDSLTEGYSRKGFIRETERLFRRADPCEYAMIMFDLRNFKALNDIFGAQCGDQILKFIFDTIQNSWLKPVISARIESDWFICLVRKTALNLERLNDLQNLHWTSDNRDINLHLRCGIYQIDSADEPVSKVVDWTILAKEAADRQESGNVALFDASMRKTNVTRAEILASFQNGIQKQEIEVYFQPVLRCLDGKICSAEALVRWNHPKKGLVSPGEFIPILERNGLISQLDQYVLGKVYRFEESLQEMGLQPVPVSINLSRQDFYNSHLINDIFRRQSESRLPKGTINYEVTETSVAALGESCVYYLNQFRKNGASILMDDFGSGYSSLGMIGNYPLDIVKIDKSFIDRIEGQPTARSILTSIIQMCHNAGLSVVAEGVETKRQNEFLGANGCDFVQGYYYYRPLCERDFRELIRTSQGNIQKQQLTGPRQAERSFDIYNLMDLLDNSGQFIQVCHPEDYSIVYANAMTLNISGHPEKPYQGRKCYEYMLGLNAPCGHCPMKKMGNDTEKEIETDDGEHVFRLKARITEWNGRKVFIEYGRDVTNTKEAQRRYASQIRSILESIPDGQGVFHMDLTDDRWISSGGHAKNARDMQNMKSVDDLISRIASFVPTAEGQKHFFDVFCRKAQLAAYSENQHQIVLETESYYDDRSIRWSRITAQLISNPSNGHVESIMYGVDMSRENRRVEELETERLHRRLESEILQKRGEEAAALHSRADHDRRYDVLTGLYSRICLSDYLEAQKENTGQASGAVIIMDIDNFKSVNERFGHAVGDVCLEKLGRCLLDFGIRSDITFYRYGGDEFVGMLNNPERSVSPVVNQLQDAIRHVQVRAGDEQIHLTVSIGYTTDGNDYNDMICKADNAMYIAKNQGKDRAFGIN